MTTIRLRAYSVAVFTQHEKRVIELLGYNVVFDNLREVCTYNDAGTSAAIGAARGVVGALPAAPLLEYSRLSIKNVVTWDPEICAIYKILRIPHSDVTVGGQRFLLGPGVNMHGPLSDPAHQQVSQLVQIGMIAALDELPAIGTIEHTICLMTSTKFAEVSGVPVAAPPLADLPVERALLPVERAALPVERAALPAPPVAPRVRKFVSQGAALETCRRIFGEGATITVAIIQGQRVTIETRVNESLPTVLNGIVGVWQ